MKCSRFSILQRLFALLAAVAGLCQADSRAAVPLTTRIQKSGNQSLTLSFDTRAGVKYRVTSSTNFTDWQKVVTLVDGTGLPQSVSVNITAERAAYFRAEELSLTTITNMVLIPAGTFLMGSSANEVGHDTDEEPITQVILASSFWMGKYEVTQREYLAVMGDNPSSFPGNLSRPVESLTWLEATDYCTRLTALERTAGRLPAGFVYRLPTEAEFEYACRAGTTTRYYFGEDPNLEIIGSYAWYGDNSAESPHPVGEKLPNGFGLFDMSGNVREWCADWYTQFFPGGVVINPRGPGFGEARVFRGGSFALTAKSALNCRSARRDQVTPDRAVFDVGFRVVLATEP